MDLSSRTGVRLHWGGVLAGGVVAIATAWTGELLGSLLGLIEPGESSPWGWVGAILALGLLVLGSFVGGMLASRIAGCADRSEGVVHGLLVWGVFGTASALIFAILGGNLALVAGSTPGAIRLAIGFAMLGLFGALFGAVAGGAVEPGLRQGRGPRRGAGRPAPTRVTAPPRPTYEPSERSDVPPSVH